VLEHCNGGDLNNFINKYGPLKEHLAKILIKQLVEGLSYLHEEKRIIHRDIKSSNMMLQWSSQGERNMTQEQLLDQLHQDDNFLKLKLVDFGFARIL
jgi:serine/threonine protein kinase